MNFSYLGRSNLSGDALSFSPNLSREPVSFDAPLLRPQRFREAISALHDIVVDDQRFVKRDKSAYLAWKAAETARVSTLRTEAVKAARDRMEEARKQPLPAGLEREHARHCATYWKARAAYADQLRKDDPTLWRQLMPCDPIVTVAEDVLLFECFSKDESSYGCLSVDRQGGFGPAEGVRLGTTNVDYSQDLYDHFQSLRSYRETRFLIDPSGFEVGTQDTEGHREEKIDLPSGWLRGFMQLQAAMTMPMRRVSLTRDAVYSLLVWLRRHKAKTSPRALRFEQQPGRMPELVVEPWEQRIPLHGLPSGTVWGEPVRIWGRQRLLSLARLLPLVDSIEVCLLGTGLPSFWIVRMGEMRLTLGLSGWTANDWTHGSSLDLLAPPTRVLPVHLDLVTHHLRTQRAASLSSFVDVIAAPAETIEAALRHLARTGQAIHDLSSGLYRWRQVMPAALGEADLGPEDPETLAARTLLDECKVVVEQRIQAPGGGVIHTAKVAGTPVEMLVDADGRLRRARCLCGHFRKAGLRMGPCRHIQALRLEVARTSLSRISRDNTPTPFQKGGA